jgi:hypothetical protein
MMALWDHYWPVIMAALVVGLVAGLIGFRAPVRRNRRRISLIAGIAAVLAFGALWHGPAGTAARFAAAVESGSRETLDAFEMTQVRARLERTPVTRSLVLSGPADDFQREKLVLIMDELPGVATVRWAESPRSSILPLLAETELAALLSFGLGLLLASLVELRRRSRAEWRW